METLVGAAFLEEAVVWAVSVEGCRQEGGPWRVRGAKGLRGVSHRWL